MIFVLDVFLCFKVQYSYLGESEPAFMSNFRLNLLHQLLISYIESVGQLERVNAALLQACIQNQTEIL